MKVSTPEDLIKMINSRGGEFEIINDIDMMGIPIKAPARFSTIYGDVFGGKVKGNNFTIKNLRLDYYRHYVENKSKCYALFGDMNNASVEDMVFENVSLAAENQEESVEFGLLAGQATNCFFKNIKVKKLHIENKISRHTPIGGLVQEMWYGSMTNCNVNIIINNKNNANQGRIFGYCGALVGYTEESSISRCTANVIQDKSIIGTMIGYCRSEIYECKTNVDFVYEEDTGSEIIKCKRKPFTLK